MLMMDVSIDLRTTESLTSACSIWICQGTSHSACGSALYEVRSLIYLVQYYFCWMIAASQGHKQWSSPTQLPKRFFCLEMMKTEPILYDSKVCILVTNPLLLMFFFHMIHVCILVVMGAIPRQWSFHAWKMPLGSRPTDPRRWMANILDGLESSWSSQSNRCLITVN